MPSISGPRSTVASNFTVTPFVSGATCSLLIVLASLYFQGLTLWVRGAVHRVFLNPMVMWHKLNVLKRAEAVVHPCSQQFAGTVLLQTTVLGQLPLLEPSTKFAGRSVNERSMR